MDSLGQNGLIRLSEICFLVLDFLKEEKFNDSYQAFSRESYNILKNLQKTSNKSIKTLSFILNEYIILKEDKRKKDIFTNSLISTHKLNGSDEHFNRIKSTLSSLHSLLDDYSMFKSNLVNENVDNVSSNCNIQQNYNLKSSSQPHLKRKRDDPQVSALIQHYPANIPTPIINSTNNSNNTTTTTTTTTTKTSTKTNTNPTTNTSNQTTTNNVNRFKDTGRRKNNLSAITSSSTISNNNIMPKQPVVVIDESANKSQSRRKNMTPKKLSISPNHQTNIISPNNNINNNNFSNSIEPIPMNLDMDFGKSYEDLLANSQIHEKIAEHINHYLHNNNIIETQPVWDDNAQHQNNLDLLHDNENIGSLECNIANNNNNGVLDNILTSMESDPDISLLFNQNENILLSTSQNSDSLFESRGGNEDILLTPGSSRRPYKQNTTATSLNRTPRRIQFSNPPSRETSPNNYNIKVTNNNSSLNNPMIPEDVDEFLSTLNYD